MNAAYSYNTQEASAIITNRIYFLLEQRHWSVKTLSDETGIPYETLKKLLSRKTENTSFHNIAKIALAFKCNLNYLVSSPDKKNLSETECLSQYTNEISDSIDTCEQIKEITSIPLFYPTSLCDNMKVPKSSSTSDALNISSYPYYIRQEAEYGIVISSYCYHPTYQERDVLLVSRKRPPHIGETAILIHDGNIYIRTISGKQGHIILESVNGLGQDIHIYDFTNWMIWGYVVAVHKSDKLVHL